MSEQTNPIPKSPEEFLNWSSKQLKPYVQGKSLILSPGGSSRWYFMEYGDSKKGYLDPDIFLDYSRITLNQILDTVAMMMRDGIETIYVVAFTPQFDKREAKYQNLMGAALALMLDDETLNFYNQNKIHVKFRGMWETVLEQYDQKNLYQKMLDFESTTVSDSHSRLIWCIQDKPIPDTLLPFVQNHIATAQEMPDQTILAHEYYNETNFSEPIFIGNNKPNLGGQLPPFLSPGDLYFTVSPTLYLDHIVWRNILFDHLFMRQVAYRNYTEITAEAMLELREFYHVNRSKVIGIGRFHTSTQTWRPVEIIKEIKEQL